MSEQPKERTIDERMYAMRAQVEAVDNYRAFLTRALETGAALEEMKAIITGRKRVRE